MKDTREKINPNLLSHDNHDATVGMACPHCGHMASPHMDNEQWPPIALVEPPPFKYRDTDMYAVVRRCPECNELCWHHGDDWWTKGFDELWQMLLEECPQAK